MSFLCINSKVIYTDIKNAFDYVSHIKLIETLSQYKNLSSLVSWFKDFLNDSIQKVVINNTFFKSFPIFSGPSRGVINPLLFVSYINDMDSKVYVNSNINLSADDTKFSASRTQLYRIP